MTGHQHTDLDGQVAVVTGGAAGIGLGAAREFVRRGARVVIADVDEVALDRAVDQIGAVGVCCDVTSDDDIVDLARIAATLGDVSLVMANAGVALGGAFTSVPMREWSRVLDVNVVGTVRTVAAFLDPMVERGAGRLVITGSSASFFGQASGFDAPYAASKHALFGMAKGLARQVGPSGVRVHLLAPRLTDTAFPRSATAWTPDGSFVTTGAPVADADSVGDVVEALMDGIAAERFLIALDPTTADQLETFARHPEP